MTNGIPSRLFMFRHYAVRGDTDTLLDVTTVGVDVQSTIIAPSYIRVALPAEWPVSEMDEQGTPDASALESVRFYVRAYDAGRRELDWIAKMPKLEVLQTLTAGVDDVLPHTPAGVTLCNAAGVHDSSTAELAVGLMIASQRNLHGYRDLQHQGAWDMQWQRGLADAHVLIVGAGHIATAIANRLVAMEATFTRVGRTARTDALGAVHAISDLPHLLPTADIVCLIVPLTPDTKGMVDAEFLSLMKEDALLVNVARGKVVDTDALVAALQRGRIRVAMDVTDPEPLPQDHPLWSAPNTIITPHIGGHAKAFLPRAQRLAKSQIQRWLDGRPLENVIANR